MKRNIQSMQDLTPDPHNANRGTERGAGMLEASLREYGAGRSLLIDKHGVVIAGNKTLEAAASIGLDKVRVVETDGTELVIVQRTDLNLATDARAKALGVADNRVAQIGLKWDADVLQSLVAEGADLSGLFTEKELAEVIETEATGGFTDPDDVPQERATDIVPGDILTLGRHRIMCGDSTNPQHVEALLAGVQPHLMVTDPPYGVEYDANWRNEALPKDGSAIGGRAVGIVLNDDRADWQDAWSLFTGDVAYVWHASNKTHVVASSLMSCGFAIRAQIVWAKHHFVIGRGDYHPQHEPCWYAVRSGRTGHYNGDRTQSTLWQIPKPHKSETGHSTQKPVECMRRPIENNSSPGQAVYEPFSGSGTTIIAAEQTGRCCYAMELNPSYVQIAVDQWEQFTGQKAERVTANAGN